MPDLNTFDEEQYRAEVERFQTILAKVPEFDWLIRNGTKLWWSIKELAQQLQLGESTIVKWIDQGLVPVWRDSGGSRGREIARSSVILHLGREHTGWYRQNQSQAG
jgi:excisionase family DNA binding protein